MKDRKGLLEVFYTGNQTARLRDLGRITSWGVAELSSLEECEEDSSGFASVSLEGVGEFGGEPPMGFNSGSRIWTSEEDAFWDTSYEDPMAESRRTNRKGKKEL